MTKRKTRKNSDSVQEFLSSVKNDTRRKDGFAVAELLKSVTGTEPAMWGASIVGFGTHHYTYVNGGPAEICKIGFSPRAQSLVFYLGPFAEKEVLLGKLGKHKVGSGGCIYVNKLADIDLQVLQSIFAKAYQAD